MSPPPPTPRLRPRVLPGGLEPGPEPEVSVLVAALNEHASLAELVARVRTTLDELGRSWELIVVDDGSTDGTAGVLRELYHDDPRLRVRVLRRHEGKSVALGLALSEARGRVLVMMDADLQGQPEEIPTLLRALDERRLDFVQSWRVRRADAHDRVWSSTLFNRACSTLSGLPLHDINCGLKVFRAEVAPRLNLHTGMHRFLPLLAWRAGFAVGEEPVQHQPRRYGRSRYGPGRVVRGLLDLALVVLVPRIAHPLAPVLLPAALAALAVTAAATGSALVLPDLAWGPLAPWSVAASSLSLSLTALALAAVERSTGRVERRAPAVSETLG